MSPSLEGGAAEGFRRPAQDQVQCGKNLERLVVVQTGELKLAKG